MSFNIAELELWGGIECTINCVQDKYFSQLEYAGYYKRNDDIDKIASLGIKALRYPLLWEMHQPEKNKYNSFCRAEDDLKKLTAYHITPITGFVHHGCGPAFVNFFDGSFEEGLAQYAVKIIKKFPHLQYFTPVNEPLTTARFCGLYGHWYPHKKDDYSFFKILLSECKATVLAMQAIRKINACAKLVQTEDLGKTHSTPLLQYQANWENIRRWLSIDLLCGSVTPEHAAWNYIINSGIDESELYFFISNKCAPDILGLNYYITSERFLDERLQYYPPDTHGKNDRHEYADVEAIRLGIPAYEGAYTLIKNAWKKYKIQIAITEVHLNCHRDEQLRWFNHIWKTAKKLKEDNIDIKAVTAWGLLGSFGWNKLLTKGKGDYEPGAFDVRSGILRPLALASLLKNIAGKKNHTHPVLQGKGWWERNIRVLYHHHKTEQNIETNDCRIQPLLIFGKTGTLGKAFAKTCEARNIAYRLLSRSDADICNPAMIKQVIEKYKPWAVINATGYVRVDDAENDTINCFAANITGAVNLAICCEQYKLQLLGFSSDLVFDGKKIKPYTETDKASPLNIYGHSKLIAEQNILRFFHDALIIRTSAFFGPWDKYNFIYSVINNLKNNTPITAADDVFISPTYIPDLANESLDLLIDGEKGIWHIANDAAITWAALADNIAGVMNLNTSLINKKPAHKMPFIAKRPAYSVLQSEKGIKLPTLTNALNRYVKEINATHHAFNFNLQYTEK